MSDARESLTVLAIADANPDMTRTLSQARLAAQDLNARLLIAGFTSKSEIDATFEPRLRGAAKRAMEGFENYSITIEDDNAIAPWVLDQCQAGKVDLIVKTGHRTETIFYSPTDWQLIRNTNVPVLLLTDGRSHKKLNTILATVDVENADKDQKALDMKVLRIANRMARDFKSTLHAGVCVSTSRILTDLDLVDIHKREKAHAPKVREIIDQEYSKIDIEDQNWHIHAGPPEEVISHIATGIKADLIVVGTIGRKKLKGWILGNTVEKILRNVRGNVLVIKPD